MTTRFQSYGISDVGRVRKVNEDFFSEFETPCGNLFIVCDGMGGHKGGSVASELTVRTVKKIFDQSDRNCNVKDILYKSLRTADKILRTEADKNPELCEMGSTAVILLIKNNFAYTAHIGDSKIYLIRDKNIYQVTKDHSLVQQMIDANIITEEAAKEHPDKNVITKCLGADGDSEPEIAEPFVTFKNDIFILCSDGLTNYVDDQELLDEFINNKNLESACNNLIDYANQRGGSDNITIQTIKITSGRKPPSKLTLQLKKPTLLIPISLLFLLITVLSFVNPFDWFTDDKQVRYFIYNDNGGKNLGKMISNDTVLFNIEDRYIQELLFMAERDLVNLTELSLNNEYLIWLKNDTTIIISKFFYNELLDSINIMLGNPTIIGISPDNNSIFAAKGSRIDIWNWKSKSFVDPIYVDRSIDNMIVALSNGNERLAIARDRALTIWDIASQNKETVDRFRSPIKYIYFSGDNKFILLVLENGKIEKREIAELKPFAKRIQNEKNSLYEPRLKIKIDRTYLRTFPILHESTFKREIDMSNQTYLILEKRMMDGDWIWYRIQADHDSLWVREDRVIIVDDSNIDSN